MDDAIRLSKTEKMKGLLTILPSARLCGAKSGWKESPPPPLYRIAEKQLRSHKYEKEAA